MLSQHNGVQITQDLWNEMQRDAIPTLNFSKFRNIKHTRKIHLCELCKRIIPIGSSCEEHTIMDSDCKKPGTVYYCGCKGEM